MRPRRIIGARPFFCTRDKQGTHLRASLEARRSYSRERPSTPPRCRRGYRGKRHVSGTTRAEFASVSTQSRVPPAYLVVERVALHRDAPGGAHEADELVELLLGSRRRAGGAEDLLPHQRPLHVVRTEVKR